VATPNAAAAEVASLRDGRPVILIGDGAERYASSWLEALPGATVESPAPNLAAAAARLAARRQGQAAAPHALRPLYLRRPDAVLARERAALERIPAPSPHDAAPAGAGSVAVFEVSSDEDLAGAAALQARVFGRAWESDALVGDGSAGNVRPRLYAARDSSGAVVAYCAAWQILDELHINSLAVDERYRRQGIASALMRQVLSRGRDAGVRSATLEVRESNGAGRALYESLGFAVEGVRRGYYEHPVEDALVLWRRD
jgi:[ribosomal protein S18]-alanine N-acetyltransferase